MGAKEWSLLVIGMATGVLLVALSGPVRDVVFGVVDAVAGWWWGLVDAVNRAVAMVGAVLLAGLAVLGAWALVVLVLPRFAE